MVQDCWQWKKRAFKRTGSAKRGSSCEGLRAWPPSPSSLPQPSTACIPGTALPVSHSPNLAAGGEGQHRGCCAENMLGAHTVAREEEMGLRTAQQLLPYASKCGIVSPHWRVTTRTAREVYPGFSHQRYHAVPCNASAAPAGEHSPPVGAESPCPELVPIITRGVAQARPELRTWAGRAQGRGCRGAGSASPSFAGQQLHC